MANRFAQEKTVVHKFHCQKDNYMKIIELFLCRFQ